MVDVQLLLDTLFRTFVEFKSHEQIENRFIMKQLRIKLKALSIKNTAVCNCHKDSRLKDILQLLQDGLNKKTIADRINYGLQLKTSLEDFAKVFLPHMEEEEEVFQPLLQQVFSYEELCELRHRVIEQHLLLKECQLYEAAQLLTATELARASHDSPSSSDEDETKGSTVETKGSTMETKVTAFTSMSPTFHPEESVETAPPPCIDDLPPEVLLHVFGYLDPYALCQAAQTCKGWSRLSLEPQLWTHILPIQWAQGDWSRLDHRPEDSDIDDDIYDDDEDDEVSYMVIDDDADIDESCDTDAAEECCPAVQQILHEAHLLKGLVKHVLPQVGTAVRSLILANSRALTNGLLDQMLQMCPNLECLDITQTRISDAGLKSFGRSGSCCRLKRLVLSGCVNVGNATLVRLAIGLDDSGATTQHMVTTPHCTTRSATENCCSVPREATEELLVEDDSDCLCLEYYRTYHKKLDKNCRDDCERQSTLHQAYEESNNTDYSEAESGEFDLVYDNDSVPELALECAAVATDVALWATDYTTTSGQMHDDMSPYTLHSNSGENLTNIFPDNDRAKRDETNEYTNEFYDSFEKWNIRDRPVALSNSYEGHRQRALEYLDLSGCFQVTDLGIRALAGCGSFPLLQHLDFSGCLKLSAGPLTHLVRVCPALVHHQLFYCDNIIDGPFADTASGCRNLQCRNRVCCRSGR